MRCKEDDARLPMPQAAKVFWEPSRTESTTSPFTPLSGSSGRLALIPFESPAIVGSSSCPDAAGSAGDFSGTRRKRHGTAAVASRRNTVVACLPRRGSGGGGSGAKSFSGPTWPATRRFTSRGRCGSESQRLHSPRRSPVGWCPKKLGASSSPRRSVGQRVCLPLPCQKIRDKGALHPHGERRNRIIPKGKGRSRTCCLPTATAGPMGTFSRPATG